MTHIKSIILLDGRSESVWLTKFCVLPVHELRPGDIKVVAAVGDSLTVSHFFPIINQSFNKWIDR